MRRIEQLRRPGHCPSEIIFPARLPDVMRRHGMSPLHMLELAGRITWRRKLLDEAKITDAELERTLSALKSLTRPIEGKLSTAPIVVPSLAGMVPPSQRPRQLTTRPVQRFWQGSSYVLPKAYDHIDLFRYKPVIAQRGPDCVGHACAKGGEVYYNLCDERLSGLFTWEYAMQKDDYPLPPQGTWPDICLEGMSCRGVCLEKFYGEDNFHEDYYVKPSAEAMNDAAGRKIETWVNLRSLIGDPETIELMCLLILGVSELDLKGRVLILGVGVPEEWLTTESLVSGVRPIPFSDEPVAGHSFILCGYFHHQGQLWFIGLENWGPKVGSANPFGYPRNLGLVFIPADFFLDPVWFWDLAIAVTHEEAQLFGESRTPVCVMKTPAFAAWTHRFRNLLIGTAGLLAGLRCLFPGNWW